MRKSQEEALRALKSEAKERHDKMLDAFKALERETAVRTRKDSERLLQLEADREMERGS